jgi:hypothetical protein
LTELAHDLVGLSVLLLVVQPILILLIHFAAVSHYHHHTATYCLILLHIVHLLSKILASHVIFILLLLLVFPLLLGTSYCARLRCRSLLRLAPARDRLLYVVDQLLKILLPEFLLWVAALLGGLGLRT